MCRLPGLWWLKTYSVDESKWRTHFYLLRAKEVLVEACCGPRGQKLLLENERRKEASNEESCQNGVEQHYEESVGYVFRELLSWEEQECD